MHRLAAALFLLLLIMAFHPARADERQYDFTAVCRQERPLVRELWQRGLYDTPDDVDAVMAAVIDGNVSKARRASRNYPLRKSFAGGKWRCTPQPSRDNRRWSRLCSPTVLS